MEASGAVVDAVPASVVAVRWAFTLVDITGNGWGLEMKKVGPVGGRPLRRWGYLASVTGEVST